MLDVVFALERSLNFFVVFEVDQAFDGILLCEACDQTVAVFVDSSNEIIRHPDIQNAVGALAMI
jgi:hypothetical protein